MIKITAHLSRIDNNNIVLIPNDHDILKKYNISSTELNVKLPKYYTYIPEDIISNVGKQGTFTLKLVHYNFVGRRDGAHCCGTRLVLVSYSIL